METRMIAVATIQLDRDDDARGFIRVGQTAEGWEVDCLTPDGVVETGALPAFRTRKEALDAIDSSWGRDRMQVWNLEWIE